MHCLLSFKWCYRIIIIPVQKGKQYWILITIEKQNKCVLQALQSKLGVKSGSNKDAKRSNPSGVVPVDGKWCPAADSGNRLHSRRRRGNDWCGRWHILSMYLIDIKPIQMTIFLSHRVSQESYILLDLDHYLLIC